MAFWENAKQKLVQAVQPRHQQEPQGFSSNRADGGFSGYVPKKIKYDADNGQNGSQGGAMDFSNMIPDGVDPSLMQSFWPVGGQAGQTASPQGMPPQGMPLQPVNAGAARPMGAPVGGQVPPRPQPQYNGRPFLQPQQGFTPPAPQQAAPQQSFQPANGTPPQQAASPRNIPQTVPFSGGDVFYVDGSAYKMLVRVAQITGVASCFHVIEFMYNNEMVIVNAEQVKDLVEADRCMDLIFGAACAMKLRLMRVSGKQIYIITPPQVYVAPFEALRRAGMEDIERRWPGASQLMAQNQQPVNNMQFMNGQMAYQQPRQDDFAGGSSRRAARNGMYANGFTDYGGFGTKGK